MAIENAGPVNENIRIKPDVQTLELKGSPKDFNGGDNIVPLAASSDQAGSAAAASAQARALPDQAKKTEIDGKDKQDKSQGQGLIDLILTKLGLNSVEKENVLADTGVLKDSSVKAIEASASRVAPEKTIQDMPAGELAKVAELKKDFSEKGIKMDQASPDHIAYNGGKAPQQQQATSHTV